MKMTNMLFFNRIFSRNSLNSLIGGEFPHPCLVAIQRCQIDTKNKSNAKVISEIYKYMSNNYRNEYIYKHNLLNELLIKSEKHNFETTSALTELRIGNSKADFVLINGKAEVYEIKTGLDNFDKLHSQITDYYKVFSNVNVVTSIEKIEELRQLLSIDSVGIYILGKNAKLDEYRCSKPNNKHLNKKFMFKILRKQEFEHIIEKHYKELPVVSQFDYYKECQQLFCNIDTDEATKLFLDKLKSRCIIKKNQFSLLPRSIKPLVYFSNISISDMEKLTAFLKSPFEAKRQ